MPHSHLCQNHSCPTHLDSWGKYDLLLLDLPKLEWLILTKQYSHGSVHKNPTFGLLYSYEISHWNTVANTCSEVCTLTAYKAISCSLELNYLKICPGVISTESSGTCKKRRRRIRRREEKTEKNRKKRIAARDSTTALNFPSKIGLCYMTIPRPSKIAHLFYTTMFILEILLKLHL